MEEISSISTTLRLGKNGIWYSQDEQVISYPSDGHDQYFTVEDSSFWFKHRNNCIISVVKSYPPEDSGTIFDIGGGNGFVAMGLANVGFDVVLVEPGQTGVINGKKRGLKNIICATASREEFRQNSLAAAGLFDVIEHIEDDLSFLTSIRSLLKKGGYLYATVPSYSCLWSEEDVLAGHFRRYSLEEISNVLKSAGFEIEFSSYVFRFLPVPVFFIRALPYKLGLLKPDQNMIATSRTHVIKGGFTAKILALISRQEIKNLNKKKAMSFGGSCLIVAKNPS
jgi:2-polyprenyl-3-methyl-5-hydroxy-6-metoxy-1,4-benzoquinol methylase